MINTLEVINENGQVLRLPLEDFSSGYAVEDIDGLDPVKATLVSSTFAGLDGEQYQSSRLVPRNVILKLGYIPNAISGDISALRKNLYKYLMPKSKINLLFGMDDMETVVIPGVVEAFDSPKFSRDPKATASIVCYDPDFVGASKIFNAGVQYSPVVPDPTKPGGMVSLGADPVPLKNEYELYYPGTASTGVILSVHSTPANPIQNFLVNHTPEDGYTRTMAFGAPTPLSDGERVIISTVPGDKYAIIRKAQDIPILYGVSEQSTWLSLYEGVNKLSVMSNGQPVPFTVTYSVRYGGI